MIWLWSICKLFRKFALERRKSENTKEQAGLKFVREQPMMDVAENPFAPWITLQVLFPTVTLNFP